MGVIADRRASTCIVMHDNTQNVHDRPYVSSLPLSPCFGMRLHMSRIRYPRVIWNDVRYARCDPKLDYLCAHNSGIVSRRFTTNNGKTGP